MYTQKVYAIATVGAGTAKVVTATGDAVLLYRVMSKIQVSRICALVTTLTATNLVAPVITVYRRPTPGSTVGQVAIGTLTIPTATAIGKVLYKNVALVSINPGEEIAFNVSTAGTDSGAAAGAFLGAFEGHDDPETAANETNMVASA